MTNIIDYIEWRGDISFAERGFCLPDNLIFTTLSYIDFKGIIPELGSGKSITLRSAWEAVEKADSYAVRFSGDIDEKFLKTAAESRRFGDILLSDYVDEWDPEEVIQFSAVKIRWDDWNSYIAFRGTDQSLLGWREDFMMSFQTVPAQQAAVYYLENTVTEDTVHYRVGGHSKGGNLAVYGSMMCSEECRSRIQQIYDNDGPGFSNEMLQSGQYEEIKDRILRIVPECCIIGKLFEHDCNTMIVKSSNKGVMQHHPLSWQVKGCRMVPADSYDEMSRCFKDTMDEWMSGLNQEERREFVQAMFDAAEAGGANSLEEITEQGINGFKAVIVAAAKVHKTTSPVVLSLLKTGVSQINRHFIIRDTEKKAELPEEAGE